MYVMTREQHVFGRGGNNSGRSGSPAPYVDTFLSAPDILPRHCTVRAGPEPPAMVRPSRGAPVTHNGCLLLREAELHPGDVLGLGEHFLFMYKDPRSGSSGSARPPWLPSRPGATPPGPGWAFSCRLCGRGLQERGEALAAYLDGREPVLRFRPREEEALLGEIVRAAAAGAGELPPLGPATLLALCVQHSARELELGHLPRLLGRLARLIKEAVWVRVTPRPSLGSGGRKLLLPGMPCEDSRCQGCHVASHGGTRPWEFCRRDEGILGDRGGFPELGDGGGKVWEREVGDGASSLELYWWKPFLEVRETGPLALLARKQQV